MEVALTQELMKHGWRSIVEWSGWREQSTLPPMFLLVIATNRIGSEAVHQQLGKGINTPGFYYLISVLQTGPFFMSYDFRRGGFEETVS